MERHRERGLLMCGIVGHCAFGDRRPDLHRWRAVVNMVRHRGPDDGTYWADGPFFFGHRRLSIIDLSSGRQPMATAEGQLVITFNGEIYNYLELRDELAARGHRFRTQSDTEVLLCGYREWGIDLLPRLAGMFAFALADRARGEMLVARDRFGEKPLLLAESAGGVSFASEVTPLALMLDGAPRLNAEGLPGYLCLNYVPGAQTLLQGVERLAPGAWRLYGRNGLLRSGRFWSPPAEQDAIELPNALERLEALLDRATRLALRSDVPVGVFLSGGIDSSLIARSAARAGRLSRAYCLSVEEATYSELPRAEATAAQLGIPLTAVPLTPAAMSDFFELVAHADEPLADSSALAVYTLSRAAARTNKVVLSGDGGDELFGGYLTYRATLWHGRFSSRAPRALRRALAAASRGIPVSEQKVSMSYKLWRFLRALDRSAGEAHFSWNGTWLPEEAGGLLTKGAAAAASPATLRRLAVARGLGDRPSLNELQRVDVQEYLPNDILTKSDRMSMAHGLEVRSPLLEPELAEFALRLPARLKMSLTGPSKRLLRELATRTYGVTVARAPKQGFSIPVHAWLRGPGREIVEDLMSPASLTAIPELDSAAVRHAVLEHMSGRRSYGFELWGLCVLVAWHRRIIQHPPPLPQETAPEPLSIPLAAAGLAS